MQYSHVESDTNAFAINITEIGDPKSFLYAFCCPVCALAESRTYFDQSSFCFNVFCLPFAIAPYRWIIRSSYGIGDSAKFLEDILLALFCPCCTINQIYQTTSAKKNPSADGGAPFNTITAVANETGDPFARLVTSCFCLPCSVSNNLHEAVGMPHILGCAFMNCCCLNLCLGRNLIRYQFRLKPHSGDDCFEECLIPCGIYCFGRVCSSIIPCLWCIEWAAFAYVNSLLVKEVQSRQPIGDNRYLVGYRPPPPEENGLGVNQHGIEMQPTVIAATSMIVPQPPEATIVSSPFYPPQHGKEEPESTTV